MAGRARTFRCGQLGRHDPADLRLVDVALPGRDRAVLLWTREARRWRSIATAIYNAFNSTGTIYWVTYFILVVGFTYFYTAVTFQQQNLPENLQKYGGFIPGIRPGRPTKEYLNRVLNRITLVGALFLGIVAVMPFFTQPIDRRQT